MSVKSLTAVVAVEKSVTSKLGKELSDALTVLKHGMEIPLQWESDDGQQSVDLAGLESRVNLYTSAFASKDKLNDKQAIKLQQGLRQARAKVAELISKAMNTDGNKLRQGIAEINKTLEDRKIVLNVDTKKRVFRFSVEEKPNDLDECDAICKDLGIVVAPAKPEDVKHAGASKAARA